MEKLKRKYHKSKYNEKLPSVLRDKMQKVTIHDLINSREQFVRFKGLEALTLIILENKTLDNFVHHAIKTDRSAALRLAYRLDRITFGKYLVDHWKSVSRANDHWHFNSRGYLPKFGLSTKDFIK